MSEVALAQIMANLPDDSDFGMLEQMLPDNESINKDNLIAVSVFQAARSDLLRRWATDDPAAAANYIIDNPQRLIPGEVVVVVEKVAMVDSLASYKWVQEFPSGTYYDSAAFAAIPYLADYPNEAASLAAKINDPALREKSFKRIQGWQHTRNDKENP